MARGWKVKTDLHEILDNDDLSTLQMAQEIDRRMNQVIMEMTPSEPDTDSLELILEDLRDAAEDDDVEAFDDVLASLYDWCDTERVWIGG